MAPGGPPGSSSRGRGGKFRKFTRGGGKHFSKNLRPLDADGNEVSMWNEDGQKAEDGSDEEEEEEEESEEEESDNAGSAAKVSAAAAAAASREDRKKEKKARKEAAIARSKGQAVQVGDLPSSDEDDEAAEDLPANPNHSRESHNQTVSGRSGGAEVDAAAKKMKDLSLASASADLSGLSRRERESIEAQQAKERYRKLHEAGKTDEAKADLARLRLIREKREEEAARKKAEKEAKEAADKERRAEIETREAKRREAALGKKKGKK